MKDGNVMSTTGVTLKVAKIEGIIATEFRTNMAKKWQQLDAKSGGSIFGKNITPFGKEVDLGDDIMKQNRFLKNSKQRIIHNLNEIDEIVESNLTDDVDMDMEVSRVTLREVLHNHKDAKGARLFDSIKKTNIGGTCRFFFDETKTVEVDAVLDNLD
jgi:hypothetical protein